MIAIARAVAMVGLLAAGLVGMPAESATVANLAGLTVIHAAAPASMDVRLPRAATVATPFEASPDLTVEGSGRLISFVLTGLDAGNRSVTIAGGTIGNADQSHRFLMPLPLFPAPGGGTFEIVKTFGDTTSIPAGLYRLYVVPDGSPARISLRLRGLTGRTVLAPTRRAAAEIVPAGDEAADLPMQGNIFTGAVNRHLAARGLALQVLVSQLDGEAAWQLLMCHDNPSARPPAAREDAPGCPSGEKHTFVDHRYPDTAPDSKLFVQGFAGLPPGDHGVGAVYTSEARAKALDYLTLWLAY